VGLNIRLEKLAPDEVQQLARIDATSAEGLRVQRRAGEVWARMVNPPRQGKALRDPFLVAFAELERIMESDELAAALERSREGSSWT
jgi:hypothetical protein